MADPVLDRLLVPLHGPSRRLLGGEAQLMHEPGDVVLVIRHAIALLDELGDAAAGPQVGREAVNPGAFEQLPHEPSLLLAAEPGRGAGGGLGVEARLAASAIGVAPASHAERCGPDASGHIGDGMTLLEQCDGSPPPTLQFPGGSFGSHGIFIDQPPAER